MSVRGQGEVSKRAWQQFHIHISEEREHLSLSTPSVYKILGKDFYWPSLGHVPICRKMVGSDWLDQAHGPTLNQEG